MKKRSQFSLAKWYLDCVADDGAAFIGYAATLRWQALTIHYASSLLALPGEDPQVRASSRKCPAPTLSGSSLHWSAAHLAVEGSWQALAPAIEQTIFTTENGAVHWRCLQPRAHAEIRVGKEHRIQGLGYAEQTLISIPPWKLPIDALRWGRYLSETESLVWIDWRGATSLRRVFRNGVQVEDATVSDREIVLDGGSVALVLQEFRILREGRLLDTALAKIPGIEKLLPMRSLQMDESKWCSRGVLRTSSTVLSTGWAIHEVVRWASERSQ